MRQSAVDRVNKLPRPKWISPAHFVVPAPGSIEGRMVLEVNKSSCGSIEDGVGLVMLPDDGRNAGGWIIAFKDLERWYFACRDLRAGDK